MSNHRISLLISQQESSSTGKPELSQPEDIYQLKRKIQSLPFFPTPLNPTGSPSSNAKHRITWLREKSSKNASLPEESAGFGGFFWVDIKDPSIAEREEIASWLPLCDRTREKLNRLPAMDRLEYFPSNGYLFLLLTSPNLTDGEESFASFVLVLFEKGFLTFRLGGFPGEGDFYTSVTAIMASVARKGGVPLSSLFSHVVANAVKSVRGLTPSLLLGSDYLNELILQIIPSQDDYADLLKRISTMRKRVARLHVSLLLKQRILKQLLLPVGIEALSCHSSSADAVECFQGALNLLQVSIEKLNQARDTVSTTGLNLVSGVSSRLLSRCNILDYINNVQTEISLVLFPTALIPSVWACNIMVPWQSNETLTPFWCLTGITVFIMITGVIFPFYKFFHYKPPGAVVPAME